MRLKSLSGFLSGLLLAGCSLERAPVPEDRMAALLTDLHLAEVRSTQVRASDTVVLTGEKNMDSLALYYREVLHHYDLDTGQFRQALDWYTAHPVALDSVYKKTVRQLEQMSQAVTPLPPLQ